MKINNFQGDLTDISSATQPLVAARRALMCQVDRNREFKSHVRCMHNLKSFSLTTLYLLSMQRLAVKCSSDASKVRARQQFCSKLNLLFLDALILRLLFFDNKTDSFRDDQTDVQAVLPFSK